MSASPVKHGSFVIERSYKAPPDKVFAAFADREAKLRWLAGGKGFLLEEYELDFRVRGRETSSFIIQGDVPVAGMKVSNATWYADIVPGARIVWAYTMSMGESPFSASLATVELSAAGSGTHLKFTEQGAFFAGADGLAMREQGWGKLLDALAQELGS